MGNIINTLLEMGPESISMFVNYFFIVLGAVGVIGFLIGFIRGVHKELNTLIITALYLALVIFANK